MLAPDRRYDVSTTAGGMVDINHSGAFALGSGTTFTMLPEAGLGIVVLANGAANGVVEGIAARFADFAQYGSERRDWLELYMSVFAQMNEPSGELIGQSPPANPEPASSLEAYAGDTLALEYVNRHELGVFTR